MNFRSCISITTLGMLGGVGGMFAALFGDGLSWADARSVSVCVLVMSFIGWIATRTRRSEKVIFELGRQTGYDAGYTDGRRIARPVVVPLVLPSEFVSSRSS